MSEQGQCQLEPRGRSVKWSTGEGHWNCESLCEAGVLQMLSIIGQEWQL